jgi:hypothetical protein
VAGALKLKQTSIFVSLSPEEEKRKRGENTTMV